MGRAHGAAVPAFVDLLPAPQRSLVMEVLRRGIDACCATRCAARAAIHGDFTP